MVPFWSYKNIYIDTAELLTLVDLFEFLPTIPSVGSRVPTHWHIYLSGCTKTGQKNTLEMWIYIYWWIYIPVTLWLIFRKRMSAPNSVEVLWGLWMNIFPPLVAQVRHGCVPSSTHIEIRDQNCRQWIADCSSGRKTTYIFPQSLVLLRWGSLVGA